MTSPPPKKKIIKKLINKQIKIGKIGRKEKKIRMIRYTHDVTKMFLEASERSRGQ